VALTKHWLKSSKCSNNGCMETNLVDGIVQLRQSTAPDAGVIAFTPVDWNKVLEQIQQGKLEFEIAGVQFALTTDEGWRVTGQGVTLNYTRREREDFVEGVRAGDFNLPATP
jgi:hypothetical protein